MLPLLIMKDLENLKEVLKKFNKEKLNNKKKSMHMKN